MHSAVRRYTECRWSLCRGAVFYFSVRCCLRCDRETC